MIKSTILCVDGEWPLFCQRITEQLAGARVKLEVIESDGRKDERVSDGTLESMTFGSDPCSDFMTVRIRSVRDIAHEMIDPIEIRLHSSDAPDDYNQIEIEAENGITILTLSPTIHRKMLEGVKIR